jgi:hypothetical protein
MLAVDAPSAGWQFAFYAVACLAFAGAAAGVAVKRVSSWRSAVPPDFLLARSRPAKKQLALFCLFVFGLPSTLRGTRAWLLGVSPSRFLVTAPRRVGRTSEPRGARHRHLPPPRPRTECRGEPRTGRGCHDCRRRPATAKRDGPHAD